MHEQAGCRNMCERSTKPEHRTRSLTPTLPPLTQPCLRPVCAHMPDAVVTTMTRDMKRAFSAAQRCVAQARRDVTRDIDMLVLQYATVPTRMTVFVFKSMSGSSPKPVCFPDNELSPQPTVTSCVSCHVLVAERAVALRQCLQRICSHKNARVAAGVCRMWRLWHLVAESVVTRMQN
jgi:hypothetical protein